LTTGIYKMISIWEKQSLLQYDVIVVGAGITGLSTAASLKESKPELNILIIERGTLPTGASTKNAGFACFGSISELAVDREAQGDKGMVKLVDRRYSGLQKTRTRLGADKMGLLIKGGYELLNDNTSHYLNDIDEVNDLLKPIFKNPVFIPANEKISTFGFSDTPHLIENPYEGQVDTGLLMKSLWQYCSQLGIQIITGTEVIEVSATEVRSKDFTFSAQAVAICTNAFTKKLTDLELTPGRGIVMAISTEKPLKASGTFHYDEGYYYFRDYHGKLIFGGGRNLTLDEEATTDFGINPKIEEKLHQDLKEMILPYTDYEVEMIWSGIMAFGPTKAPVLKKTEDGIYLGVRLGGMGVALGSLVGAELSELILSEHF
jgi:glycine/D-amino acid oxidase-like deaminating enzyme